jgi:hypoxanthine phosphoribosyltransferase
MSHEPYDYSHRVDVRPVSWNDMHGICKGLVRAVVPFGPQIILAVGRGGYYPGTLIAHILQAEIYPVRLSRRVNDIVTHEHPVWLVEPPAILQRQRVLIVDEISSTGETLAVVRAKAVELGAAEVRTAVLYAHSWGTAMPDYIGLVSDTLLLNPWDREIYRDGQFQMHPEYVGALAEQGLAPDPSFLVDAPEVAPAKGMPSE